MRYKSTPFILLPFAAIFDLIQGIIKLTGRLVAVIIGIAIMIVGVVLCITVFGAIIGIPMILFGFTLMVRGFF